MLLTISPVKTTSFKWDISANISYNTSEVLQLGQSPADTVIAVSSGGGRILKQVVGKPIGALYTFLYKRDAQGRQVFDQQQRKTPSK